MASRMLSGLGMPRNLISQPRWVCDDFARNPGKAGGAEDSDAVCACGRSESKTRAIRQNRSAGRYFIGPPGKRGIIDARDQHYWFYCRNFDDSLLPAASP